MLIGSKRAVERARAMAEQAQLALPTAGSIVRVIQLPPGSDPAALREVVLQTVAVMAPPGGRPWDLARRVSIVADPQGGTLVIAAPERDMERVLDATAKIVAGARGPTGVRPEAPSRRRSAAPPRAAPRGRSPAGAG